ncbi:hypothetical protein DPMN_148944, partial [Dreissena polymorpha]
FTLHEQANLRRIGVGKPRPVLDQEKLDLLRGKTIQGRSTYPKGEIREGLPIADRCAMVDVISKKFALPISTVAEKNEMGLKEASCVVQRGEFMR